MERLKEELASMKVFIFRAIKYQAMGTALLVAGVAPGVAGFLLLEDLSIHEALLNCLSMLGAVDIPHQPQTILGRYFIAFYGIFLDSVFLVSLGTVLAPFVHRLLHHFSLHSDRKN